MRVSQHEKLLTFELVDVKNGVGVALDNTVLANGFVSHFVLWTSSTHEGSNFVQFVELALEELEVVDVVGKLHLFREAFFGQICQCKVDLSSFNEGEAAVQFGITFLKDRRP